MKTSEHIISYVKDNKININNMKWMQIHDSKLKCHEINKYANKSNKMEINYLFAMKVE